MLITVVFMWRTPQENVAYKLILISSAVPACLCAMGGKWLFSGLSGIRAGRLILHGRLVAERPLGFNWATFRWASCIIDTVVTLVLHWTQWCSLSYNQAYVPGPRFGSMSSQAHQVHIALSGPMTGIVQQGSSRGSFPTFHSLKSPL